MLDAVKQILLRESLNQPLMVIFEDLHWIDEQTQEFLNLLADSIGTARILLLVSYRPEYSHLWGSKTYYTQLRLDPLGHESAEEMLTTLMGDSTDLAPLRKLIIERTEGNPFFMEEMVQVLLDDGALVRDGNAVKLTRSLDELRIPATVQAILSTRIDGLPTDEKELLQTLAVIGKKFALSLVHSIAECTADDLGRMLDHLQLAEFIYEQPATGDVEYTFKHALTREVAYGSMLGERRRVLHDRAGQAIESLYSGHLEDHLPALAHHFTHSANAAKAVRYLSLAAHGSLLKSAYDVAIAHVQNALLMLRRLPESAERDSEELGLQLDYGVAMLARKGWYVTELTDVYHRVLELSERTGDDVSRFSALDGLCSYHRVRGEHPKAREYADQLMRLAARAGDDAMTIQANWAMGCSHFFMADFDLAHAEFEESVRNYNRDRHSKLAHRFGSCPAMSSLIFDALTLWILGFPEKAEARMNQSLKLARELGHPFTLVWCLCHVGEYRMFRGEYESFAEIEHEGLALSEQYNLELTEATFRAYSAMIALVLGKKPAAPSPQTAAKLPPSPQAYELKGTWARCLFAEGFLKVGKIDNASRAIGAARGMMQRNREHYFETEIDRLDGDITLLQSAALTGSAAAVGRASAEKLFRRALSVARERHATAFELRAAMSLSKLLVEENRHSEARETLGTVCARFTEGFEEREYLSARELLSHVESAPQTVRQP
jgi:tetratricopeptide (TPR) repeat protein